jgi:hypothetical protein
MMTLENWLKTAIADTEKRGLPELKALLEGLAQSTRALRDAGFMEAADGRRNDSEPPPAGRP